MPILPEPVERAIPWSGPCGLCGGPDARHRVLDTIHERITAGEPAPDVADDHQVPLDVAVFIADHWHPNTERWEDK